MSDSYKHRRVTCWDEWPLSSFYSVLSLVDGHFGVYGVANCMFMKNMCVGIAFSICECIAISLVQQSHTNLSMWLMTYTCINNVTTMSTAAVQRYVCQMLDSTAATVNQPDAGLSFLYICNTTDCCIVVAIKTLEVTCCVARITLLTDYPRFFFLIWTLLPYQRVYRLCTTNGRNNAGVCICRPAIHSRSRFFFYFHLDHKSPIASAITVEDAAYDTSSINENISNPTGSS